MQLHLLRRLSTGLVIWFTTNTALATPEGNWADRSNYNLRPGITEVSHQVRDISNYALWVVSLIGLLVLVLMFWSMIRHRKKVHPIPSKVEGNMLLEITWTVIPVIILISLAWPATKLITKMYDTADSQLTVKVTGSRWHWNYTYVSYLDDDDLGISFYSNLATPQDQYNDPILPGGLFPYGTAKDLVGNGTVKKDHNYLLEADKPLVLPSNTKIRFLITSKDVIHSFFVPDFGWKKDAIPGYINSDWTKIPAKNEGTYFGSCAELCGKGHAFMPIEVKVVSTAKFKSWLAKQQAAAASGPDLTPFAGLDDALALGKKVFHGKGTCHICHGDKGQGGIGPKMAGNPIFTEAKNIHKHIYIVTHGLNAMPNFSDQLTPRQIAGVITYERNAFGNNTGQLIQPADVVKVEKEK